MGNAPIKTIKDRTIRLPPEREGESEIIRSVYSKDGLMQRDNRLGEVYTLHDALASTAKKFPKNQFVGIKKGEEYVWLNYAEVYERSIILGSGLIEYGLSPKEKIGISSINRLEWNLTEYACNANSICLVPLYDTLGREGCVHILNECELSTIVCAGEKVKTLLEYASEAKFLRTIIHFDDVPQEIRDAAEKLELKLVSFHQIEELGKKNPQRLNPPVAEDLATICYTSGTTGLPKGALLTHANLISGVSGLSYGEITILPTDVHISYLPSAHILERIVASTIVFFGASFGYYSGDVRKLFDDIALLKPTLFVTVPRLLGRLYDKVMEAVKIGGITQTMFEKAYSDKQADLKKGYYTNAVWDNIVFAKVKGKLGGRVRFIITGSAPIAPNLIDFLRISFCCPVLEGYGQTETCGAGTRTLLGDHDTGHVGVPQPSVEVKLVDVPEMNYFATDNPPRGEICFRGPCCTSGYYRSPEKTSELIDDNGWLHSGDVGCLLPEGNLRIIDRKKNIFKLSLGEYVAPEKIENIFVQSKFVAQNFIYGDSLKASVIGIIVPDPDVLLKWAEDNNHPQKGNLEALCQDEEINKMIMDDMVAVGKKQGLKGFEFPRKIHLSHQSFTVDNDMLTPTFKLKRPQAKNYFIDHINRLYEGAD